MKVLVSAYACEPGKGSEPGAGWAWAAAAAREHDVWVLTRTTNRAAIEAELAARPQPRLRFVYLDLPPRLRAWKKKNRGIRLYYTLWQLLAARAARRLHRAERFDLVHHVTFANLWLPALACLVPAPFVLGPVGGGQRVPRPLYPLLGARAAAAEALLRALRLLQRANPLVRLAWSRARVILVQNEETRAALPARLRARAVLRPNTVVPSALGSVPVRRNGLVAAYAGRLNRFKAPELALRALAHAPGWRLLVVGRGPDERRLRRLADELGLDGRVEFVPWLPQAELWPRLASCRALLFPSLKEGAPWVPAEAQALGVPVVALDLAGPRVYARMPGARFELVQPGPPEECARAFGLALRRLEREPLPAERPDFSEEAIARDLGAIYRRARA